MDKISSINSRFIPSPSQSPVSSRVDPHKPEPHQDAPSQAEQGGPQVPPTQTELGQAVDELNGFVQSVQRQLQFRVDDTTGRTVVKVIDRETDEVIRQIPPEEVLRLAQYLREGDEGLMFRAQV